MKIKFECPHCQQPMTCDREFGGKEAPCPHCKMTLTVPLCATVRPIFKDAEGLENQLRTVGLMLSLLCFFAVIGLVIASFVKETPQFVPAIVGLVLVGVVQHYFFAWAAELLAAVKKGAGLAFNPTMDLYSHERIGHQCNNCFSKVPDDATICPSCKRRLAWPDPVAN